MVDMARFELTVEVSRAVPATRTEANELARVFERFLQQFTFPAKVVKVRTLPTRSHKKVSHGD